MPIDNLRFIEPIFRKRQLEGYIRPVELISVYLPRMSTSSLNLGGVFSDLSCFESSRNPAYLDHARGRLYLLAGTP